MADVLGDLPRAGAALRAPRWRCAAPPATGQHSPIRSGWLSFVVAAGGDLPRAINLAQEGVPWRADWAKRARLRRR